jgi:hypothetical protein
MREDWNGTTLKLPTSDISGQEVSSPPYWLVLVILDGEVIAIEQQYIP